MFNDVAALYTQSPAWFAGSVFLIGLLVGSFLNVVIYRLPIMLERRWQADAALTLGHAAAPDAQGASVPELEHTPAAKPAGPLAAASATASPRTEPSTPSTPFTLVTPRSRCPHCQAPITAWQNIPLVSWLVLKGRCAACGRPISARYPLVELATGVLSAAVAWHFGFGPAAACALLVTWSLIALTGIDVDHQLLPDGITLPLIWAGLLASVLVGATPGVALPVAPREAILGAAAGYLSLWAVYHAFRLITGKEGMGYGDFKLFAALGAWLGWKMLPLVILLSAGTGALLGIALILFRGRDRAAPLPFGPYLAAAGWLAMLYGEELVNGYLAIAGLKH